MHFITDWFLSNTNMVSALQVALDILMIALLLYHVTKPAKKHEGTEAVVESLQQVIDETRQIAETFDNNLQERQELMRGIIKTLDRQVREAETVYRKLDELRNSMDTISSTQISAFASTENQDIIRLARNGLDARTISRKLQKPLGEVELILSLARISTD
jgi:cell shape-determining protein MreC